MTELATLQVKVQLPSTMAMSTGGAESVIVAAESVGGALQSTVVRYPLLREHLFNTDGQLRKFVNVYVGENNIRTLSGLDTALAPGQQVTILTAVAGG